MKKRDWKSIISIFVLICFIAPIGYTIYKIIVSPVKNVDNIEGLRVKADYYVMLFQCIIGVTGFFLPNIISKRAKIIIPSNMYIAYILFLYGCIFLGEIRNYYYKIPNWDTILHTFSGAMLGIVGFSFVNIINKNEKVHVELSPVFVVIFAFCFAVALGVIWEICEFTVDDVMGSNMQKFAMEDGTAILGREALKDTMEDLIVDTMGAFVMSIIGYISIKYKKGWIDRFLINRK